MTYPTVTITVKGSGTAAAAAAAADDVNTLVSSLHMVYAQAVKGDQRIQWVVFPPANETLGVAVSVPGQTLLLNRTQQFAGNRSKWFHQRLSPGQTKLTVSMNNYANAGWTLGGIVVVPLELDDYRAAWFGDTPHKAMRAIDRALKPLGLSVKGK